MCGGFRVYPDLASQSGAELIETQSHTSIQTLGGGFTFLDHRPVTADIPPGSSRAFVSKVFGVGLEGPNTF